MRRMLLLWLGQRRQQRRQRPPAVFLRAWLLSYLRSPAIACVACRLYDTLLLMAPPRSLLAVAGWWRYPVECCGLPHGLRPFCLSHPLSLPSQQASRRNKKEGKAFGVSPYPTQVILPPFLPGYPLIKTYVLFQRTSC